MMITELKSNAKALADKADDIRKRTAGSLESAADSVRTAGSQAGKKLDTTATFVRNARIRNAFGAERMFSRFRNRVRRNPFQSLAIAIAVGAVAGFSCRASR